MKEPIQLAIGGMTCASCVSHVEKALKKVEGVSEASVNLATEKAQIKFSGNVTAEQLIKAVEDAGYEAKEINHQHAQMEEPKNNPQWKVVASIILSLPLFAPMLLMPFGIHWMIPAFAQFVLASIVQFYFGLRFYKARTANMDLLVALGTTAAYGLSIYQMTFNPNGHLYFESSAVVITLVLLGKYLEARAKLQTTAAIRALQELRPEEAHVLRNGKEITVAIDDVQFTDEVIVRAGERIPVDGIVLEGSSSVDESLITGESMPVNKDVKSSVTGGTINGEGVLRIQITAMGTESVLSKIIRLVEDAQMGKAPIQRLADKISAVFVPIVLALAGITLLLWGFISGNWELALINSVSVLVIACPCALGLATPTSIMVGTGIAAKMGILIKDAESLERAHSITTIVFDKTGTLTEGKPKVTGLHSINGNEIELLTKAMSLQLRSVHPLAKAVVAAAKEKKISIPSAQQLKTIPGKGVMGKLPSGENILLGNRKLLEDQNINIEPTLDQEALAHEQQGRTISWLVEDKKIIGFITFSDVIKNNARNAIFELRKLEIKTIMLTGDNEGSAKVIARELGIDEYRSGVLPGDKAKEIESLKEKNKTVAMVGDGINDAPALAAADIGMAMATGTDVAMHTAGITLMRGDPSLILNAILISRKTYTKIRQNLFWAFFYNIIGIPLAALGYLSPVIAGTAMAFSSVTVVGNALLMKRQKTVCRNHL